MKCIKSMKTIATLPNVAPAHQLSHGQAPILPRFFGGLAPKVRMLTPLN